MPKFVGWMTVVLVFLISRTAAISQNNEITYLEGAPSIDKVAWSHSGIYLAGISSWIDGDRIFIWDMNDYSLVNTIEITESSPHDLIWSRDDNYIVVGGTEITIWDARTGEFERTLDDATVSANVLALSADGSYLAATNYDSSIFIWNTQTWQLEKTLPKGTGGNPNGEYNPLVWHPYEAQLATYDSTEGLRIINVLTGETHTLGLAYTLPDEPKDSILASLAWSPSGEQIIGTGGWLLENSSVWDLVTSKRESIDMTGRIVSWETSSNRIALVNTTSLSQDLISILNGTTFEVIETIYVDYEPDTAGISDLEWSPDGKRLAFGLDTGTVGIWGQ